MLVHPSLKLLLLCSKIRYFVEVLIIGKFENKTLTQQQLQSHIHSWAQSTHSWNSINSRSKNPYSNYLNSSCKTLWEGNVFLSISWCSQSGDHPGENLAKSGYKPDNESKQNMRILSWLPTRGITRWRMDGVWTESSFSSCPVANYGG